MEHLDVAIIGAGLSGIGAAAPLRRDHPDSTVAVFEARSTLGGTWDLFRYPGVRSDSDMFTFSYWFRPWSDDRVIAPGDAILDYLRDTARDEHVDELIRYESRVTAASWSSADQRWTLDVVAGDTTSRVTCSFLFICTGYYRYDEGYSPHWPGEQDFTGTIVHPQHWPDDLDYAGRRVVVIGSGATAVTLVPALAATASRVTMVQRSPSYVASVPGTSDTFSRLARVLPEQAAHRLVRGENIVKGVAIYQFAQRVPGAMKWYLRRSAVRQLPEGFDVAEHFQPAYGPWDQRLCAAPDGDFFRAIRSGRAEVVTGSIERFTADGIEMTSGESIGADVIVSATGLNLMVFGGIDLTVDGEPVDISTKVAYKGVMLSDVPNLAFAIGYTNATWALKVNLVIRWVSGLLGDMRARRRAVATPVVPQSEIVAGPFIDMPSGYIQRSVDSLPRQGSRAPWRLHQNYLTDRRLFADGSYDDIRFTPAPASPRTLRLDVDGTSANYRVSGEGPAVLLLHGIGRTLEDWAEQHELLSANHRVYSLDLAGFGESEPLAGRHSVPALARFAAAFMKQLQITDAHVVGNSMGGAVAMTLAANFPSRVRSLVLVDSAGFGRTVTPTLRVLGVRPVAPVLMRPSLKGSARVQRALFVDPSFATRRRIEHAFAMSSRPHNTRVFLEAAQSMGTVRGVKPGWRRQLLERMRERGLPILVVWGDGDLVLPASHLDSVPTVLPHAQTHLFRRAGHMPQIERAQEFADLALDFWSRTEATGGKG